MTLKDALTGRRKDRLLGEYDSDASREEYKRVVLQWEADGRRPPDAARGADRTVAELIKVYWCHVEEYYRRADGTPTGEVQAMRYALRPLNHLHGRTMITDFGPTALKAVRELLVRGYDHPKYGAQQAVCRTRINAQMKRIRRMFKWAVENDMAPASVHQALCAVAPLKRGRTQARESEPVKPVARAVVQDTLPILRPLLADMVCLQLETGMRPGEMVVLRACDLDMTGPVWLYRPSSHKTQHHGHERVVPIGPKGQEIIRRHLTTNTHAFLFSPRRLMEERAAALRANRKSKVQPSQQNRKKARPKKTPCDVYSVQAYGRAIAAAIKRHNRGKPEAEHIPHWHPHQLRHLRALELKREVGLDAARAVLGHRSPVITEHYATLDIGRAAEVMAKLG
ncbi:MAG TPA: tyrosine-type recombinase/integrase [Gemmataceae bacterium]|nr:tyrosine-type recombinase/integrase [Gemmataceae bacterium]